LIDVFAEHEEDVAADKVDLFVEVEGSSLFTGRAALAKAREVHSLVESLGQVSEPKHDARYARALAAHGSSASSHSGTEP